MLKSNYDKDAFKNFLQIYQKSKPEISYLL